MDPNLVGFPAVQQYSGNSHAPFYSNAAVPVYFPQSKTPSQPPQQHPFVGGGGAVTAVPLSQQQLGPSGAMAPFGFPPRSSGPHASFPTPFAQPPVPTAPGQFSPLPTTQPLNLPTVASQSYPQQNMMSVSTGEMNAIHQTLNHQASPSQGPGPHVAARERVRVSALLEVNSMLLQEVVNLQAAGRAGPPPQQQGSQSGGPSVHGQTLEAEKKPFVKPSQEYIECMRRLQANLAYLAAIADRTKKSGGIPPSAPAIMTPPPNMPSMNEAYAKLSRLFPKAGSRTAAMSATPQANLHAVYDNGNPNPSLVAE